MSTHDIVFKKDTCQANPHGRRIYLSISSVVKSWQTYNIM